MESQPQNLEFRIHPESFHPCNLIKLKLIAIVEILYMVTQIKCFYFV